MTVCRGFLSAVLLTCGVALLPAFVGAQGAGARVAVANALPLATQQQWTPVRCATCARAGVSVEFSRLPDKEGHTQGFVVARVRNLTQRDVKGSIEVLDAELPDNDGHTPSQMLWFELGPLGKTNGELLVLLPYPTLVSAVAYSVGQW